MFVALLDGTWERRGGTRCRPASTPSSTVELRRRPRDAARVPLGGRERRRASCGRSTRTRSSSGPNTGIWVVADGLGGHPTAKSRAAWSATRSPNWCPTRPSTGRSTLARQRLQMVNDTCCGPATRAAVAERSASTVVVLLARGAAAPSSGRATAACTGCGPGALEQLTRDHSRRGHRGGRRPGAIERHHPRGRRAAGPGGGPAPRRHRPRRPVSPLFRRPDAQRARRAASRSGWRATTCRRPWLASSPRLEAGAPDNVTVLIAEAATGVPARRAAGARRRGSDPGDAAEPRFLTWDLPVKSVECRHRHHASRPVACAGGSTGAPGSAGCRRSGHGRSAVLALISVAGDPVRGSSPRLVERSPR